MQQRRRQNARLLSTTLLIVAIGFSWSRASAIGTVSSCDSSGLCVRIEPLKSRYVFGEPIWVSVTVLNYSSQDISLPHPTYGTKYLRLLNFNDCDAPPATFIVAVEWGMHAMERIEWIEDIALLPGRYHSQVIEYDLRNERLSGQDLPTDTLKISREIGLIAFYDVAGDKSLISNPTCVLIEPIPDSLLSFWHAFENWSRIGGKRRATDSMVALDKHMPDSPWAPSLIHLIMQMKGLESAWDYSLRLLTDFPDSPLCDHAIIYLNQIAGSKGLHRLLTRAVHPPEGSRLSDLIEQLLSGEITMAILNGHLHEVAKNLHEARVE